MNKIIQEKLYEGGSQEGKVALTTTQIAWISFPFLNVIKLSFYLIKSTRHVSSQRSYLSHQGGLSIGATVEGEEAQTCDSSDLSASYSTSCCSVSFFPAFFTQLSCTSLTYCIQTMVCLSKEVRLRNQWINIDLTPFL